MENSSKKSACQHIDASGRPIRVGDYFVTEGQGYLAFGRVLELVHNDAGRGAVKSLRALAFPAARKPGAVVQAPSSKKHSVIDAALTLRITKAQVPAKALALLGSDSRSKTESRTKRVNGGDKQTEGWVGVLRER